MLFNEPTNADEIQTTVFDQKELWNETFTGDLEEMLERRRIRALVVYNKMQYFLDGPVQRGASYEALLGFEKFLNERFNTKTRKVRIIFIPVTRDRIIPALIAGKGDIAAANLTITEERLQQVDFTDPFGIGVQERIVTHAGEQPLTQLEELSGRTVYVRSSSSYYESLQNVNRQLLEKNLEPIDIVNADENLEDSDLLELLNAKVISTVVVDSHKGKFWSQIFNDIQVHNLAIRVGGEIGWAIRKSNLQLKKVASKFVGENKKGTLFGNIIYNRYLKDNEWIKNSLAKGEFEKFQRTLNLFKKYGKTYGFDELMLAAVGYQESGLDQSARSSAGAIGVMQMLPSTADDPNVNIDNIEKLENNIHAGTKYLRFLKDQYFDEADLNSLNQTLFTFASYNAGPTRIRNLRNEAQEVGMDPNTWFGNVEVIAAKRIGGETVQYVANIYKYFIAYKLISERLKARENIEIAE